MLDFSESNLFQKHLCQNCLLSGIGKDTCATLAGTGSSGERRSGTLNIILIWWFPPVPFLIYIYIEDCSGDRQCAFPDPRLLSRANNKSQDFLDTPAYKIHDLRKKIADP